eukprot:TRINITY_DN29111_c0_g1_i1.p1 TRINITY_DN29111_c0_g1~~TRINITY_DN29111_c0_g1_i1.p1  ORF type:complete len:417 (-),score=94.19 TRINITY_DN29111_c0_g1_i1:46-1296(-)
MAAAATAPYPSAPRLDAEPSGTAKRLEREANQLAEAGHFRKAAQMFARASEQDPSSARFHEARAQCLMELDELEEACVAAQSAAALGVGWAPAHATLGRALLNLGRLQDAAESLEQALRLARRPNASRSEAELAEELTDELKEARRLLERHWQEHHDLLVPLRSGALLRVRQGLDCRYCRLASGELGPGGAVWAASIVLTAHVEACTRLLPDRTASPTEEVGVAASRRSSPWKGARVLELGSGTGAGGLSAAAAGAEVLLTDRETLLPLLQLNAELNADLLRDAGGSAACCTFDWLSPAPEVLQKSFDVVLAADLVYSFAAVEPLTTALAAVLRVGPGENRKPTAPGAIYAHNPRSPELDEAMYKSLAARGLQASKLELPKLDPVGHIPLPVLERVVLLEITPTSSSGSCDAEVKA